MAHASLSILVSILLFGSTSGFAATEVQIDSTSRSIVALDSARNTALKELENSSLSTTEAADYKDFIVYLNTRILIYCRQLQQLGALAALAGLPCPSVAGPGAAQPAAQSGQKEGTPVAAGAAVVQSGAEKAAELEDEFLGALGQFDDMLLKEEEQIASRIPSQRETGAPGLQGPPGEAAALAEGGKAGRKTSSAREAGAEAGAADVPTEGRTGSASGGEQRSRRAAVASEKGHPLAATPEGRLPPPEDDDIVARQLRAAAEKEPDPELKKKLWEEYWRYKGVSPPDG